MKKFYLGSMLLPFFFFQAPLRAQETPGGLTVVKGYRSSMDHGLLSISSRVTGATAGIRNNQPLTVPPPPPDGNIEYQYYDIQTNGFNMPTAKVSDGLGNIYITGTSSNEMAPNSNIYTIKVNENGQTLWSAREDSSDYTTEMSYAITLDIHGNPIVAGTHWNGHDTDIKIIKYDMITGDVLWNTIFDGGQEGVDMPVDITVDVSGNVIVAGASYSDFAINFVTIKFNGEGTELWHVIDQADVPEVWSEPVGLAIDVNGDIIVAGFSTTADELEYYYTIKYSAEGELLWKKNYIHQALSDPDDPGSNLMDVNATAASMALDSTGNCYITGIFDSWSPYACAGTIKYSPEGDQMWTKSYKSGIDMTKASHVLVLDDVIYVAGFHYSDWESEGSFLISYTTAGVQDWVQEDNDFISVESIDLGVSMEGNPFIALDGGMDDTHAIRVTEYSSEGQALGSANYSVTESLLGGMTNMVGAAAINPSDYHIVSYSYYTDKGSVYEYAKVTEGAVDNPEWTETYGNFGASSTSLSEAKPDTMGNTYALASYSVVEPGVAGVNGHNALVKYNDMGDIVWSKTFEGYNYAFGTLAVDNNDEILVLLNTDSFFNVNGNFIRLLKYKSNGDLVWEVEKELFSPNFLNLVVDSENNIYLAGTAYESQSIPVNIFNVTRYSAAGQELWSQFYPSANAQDNSYFINDAATDSNNNLIFTGSVGAATWANQNFDVITAKITTVGNVDWELITPTGSTGMGLDVVVDENDAVFVVGGMVSLATGNNEMFFQKLEADGVQAWNSTYSENGSHAAISLIPSPSGGYVVTGSAGLSIYPDVPINFAARYSDDGVQQWIVYSNPWCYFADSYVDNAGNTYILNKTKIDAFPYRIAPGINVAELMKVTPQGVVSYETFKGPAYAQFEPRTLSYAGNSTMLIGGTLSHEMTAFSGVYFIGTTVDDILDIPDNPSIDHPLNWLGQNYPNPADSNSMVKIPFSLRNAGMANIRLYDMKGIFIKELFGDNCSEGLTTIDADITGLSKGIYIYRLESRGFIQSKKIIIQ
jgi:hypothetical protein